MKEMIFDQDYSSEELCDVERDVSEAFDPVFNSAMREIAVDEHGFHKGFFRVKIEYIEENECDHQWVSAVNEVIKNGYFCPKCNAIKA